MKKIIRKGFDERNLNNMRAFYQAFPIWNAVRTELSWTHYRLLARIEDANKRQIRQMLSAKSLDKSPLFFLAMKNVNHYINSSKPAAPLSDMRNSAGLLLINYRRANNTSHASHRNCAPWGVTFFMATDHKEGHI